MSQPKDDYPTCFKCGAELPVPIAGELLRCLNCNTVAGSRPPAPPPLGSNSDPVEAIPVGPVDAIPMEPAPVDAVPVDAEPLDAEPVGALPAEAIPVNAAPVESVPVEAIPVDALPVDAMSADSVPPPLLGADQASSAQSGSANPYAAPINSQQARATMAATYGFPLLIFAIAIAISVLLPTGIPLVAIVGSVTVFRTYASLRADPSSHATISTFGDHMLAFIKSLLICSAIAFAAVVAAFVTCITVLPLSSVSESFGAVAIIGMIAVPIIVFTLLVMKTWPKRFRPHS